MNHLYLFCVVFIGICGLLEAHEDKSYCLGLDKGFCDFKFIKENCPHLCNYRANVNGTWSQWGAYSSCTVTCGQGLKTRTRTCDDPAPIHNGTCVGESSETTICYNDGVGCPDHILLTGVTDCFSKCGNKAGNCPGVCPAGSLCCKAGESGCEADVAVLSPTDYMCVMVKGSGNIDGYWGSWLYSSCTATCGAGNYRTRQRSCNNPAPRGRGTGCGGKTHESENVYDGQCSTEACPPPPTSCPVSHPFAYSNGVWCCTMPYDCHDKHLSSASTCCYGFSQACSSGRCVDYEAPTMCPLAQPYAYDNGKKCCSSFTSAGGASCQYSHLFWRDAASCCTGSTATCGSVYGCQTREVDNWTGWGSCTLTCGETGTQERTRNCLYTNVKGSCGVETLKENQACNRMICPIHGGYTQWSSWNEFQGDPICTGLFKYKTRQCTNPVPGPGGDNCTVIGDPVAVELSNSQPCPVNGQWAQWGTWGSCDKYCGGGVQTKIRLCTNPKPRFGGKACEGDGQMTKACNAHACPECSPTRVSCEDNMVVTGPTNVPGGTLTDVSPQQCADFLLESSTANGFNYDKENRRCAVYTETRVDAKASDSFKNNSQYMQCELNTATKIDTIADSADGCNTKENNTLTGEGYVADSSNTKANCITACLLARASDTTIHGMIFDKSTSVCKCVQNATGFVSDTDFDSCYLEECPFGTPYVFNDGAKCCPSGKEADLTTDLTFESTTCAGTHANCTFTEADLSRTCQNNQQELKAVETVLTPTNNTLEQCSIGDYTCYEDTTQPIPDDTNPNYAPHTLDSCASFCNALECSGFAYDKEMRFCLISKNATIASTSEDGTTFCERKGTPSYTQWSQWTSCGDGITNQVRFRGCVVVGEKSGDVMNDIRCEDGGTLEQQECAP